MRRSVASFSPRSFSSSSFVCWTSAAIVVTHSVGNRTAEQQAARDETTHTEAVPTGQRAAGTIRGTRQSLNALTVLLLQFVLLLVGGILVLEQLVLHLLLRDALLLRNRAQPGSSRSTDRRGVGRAQPAGMQS